MEKPNEKIHSVMKKIVEDINLHLPSPDDPDFYERFLLQSLDGIIIKCKNGDKSPLLLDHLLGMTSTYLEGLVEQSYNTPRQKLMEELHDKYQLVALSLSEHFLEKSITRERQGQAIGLFVEALIHFGMPRIAAIKATKEWLGIGQSTVRTHNENYRKGRVSVETHLYFSPWSPIIQELIEKNPNFPCTHPKAKLAFSKLKGLIEEKTRALALIKSS